MIAQQTTSGGIVADIPAAAWIQTYTGRRFSFADPQPEDIDIRDIARGLAMQCRFNGHCRRFYSVAEHSVRASWLAPFGCRREALLHDAAEAYTGDCVRPLKVLLGDSFRSVEHRIERVIAERFGLTFPWPAAVKAADDLLLTVEARDLMGETGPLAEVVGPARQDLRIVETLTAVDAERRFLDRFWGLFPEHDH